MRPKKNSICLNKHTRNYALLSDPRMIFFNIGRLWLNIFILFVRACDEAMVGGLHHLTMRNDEENEEKNTFATFSHFLQS